MNLVSLLFHDVYARDAGESGFSSPAANRYKLSLRDFEAQLTCLAAVREQPPVLATDWTEEKLQEERGGSERSRLAFSITVDDGGLSYYTHVADRLEALGWRGHCFITTDMIGRRGFLSAAQLRELDRRGHVVGSHSASHPSRFSLLNDDDMRREWMFSRQVLEDLLGHEILVASVPGGYFSRRVACSANEAGVRVLFTSEPTIALNREEHCLLPGRFTLRRGCPRDLARRLVEPPPWARCGAWAAWNVKGMLKPVLGASYMRVADWLLTEKT
jgi:peptidoglycan/xylan/chitin deacetylase (PgdA/CDA1 family)